MIVKGKIKAADNASGIYSTSDIKYNVEIPAFQASSSSDPVVLKAVLSSPSNYESVYQEGDIVFVAFEQNCYNHPVIIGSLYSEKSKDVNLNNASSNLTLDSLKVNNFASIPEDSDLGGITPREILESLHDINQSINILDRNIVTVSNTGTSTNEISYITVGNTEYKLANSGNITDVEVNGVSVVNSEGVAEVIVPTKVSDLTNDSGFITTAALSGYATESWVNQQGYLTNITSSDVISALGYTPGTSNFSGNYADLTGKPVIPTISGTNDGTNWTSITINNSTYSIPQSSSGTITDVQVNGTSVVTNNVAQISLPITYYSGNTYGECYTINAPNNNYSIQVGDSGFTVDSLYPGESQEETLFQVNSNGIYFDGQQVPTIYYLHNVCIKGANTDNNDKIELNISYISTNNSNSSVPTTVIKRLYDAFGTNYWTCSGILKSAYFAAMLPIISCRGTASGSEIQFTYVLPYNNSNVTSTTSLASNYISSCTDVCRSINIQV